MSTATASPAGTGFSRQVPKPWGHELIFTPSGLPYTGKVLYVTAGHRLSLQVHDVKLESMTLLSGHAILQLENDAGQLTDIDMQAGIGYTIYPGKQHRLMAITDAAIMEASTPECGSTLRLEDDFGRPDEHIPALR